MLSHADTFLFCSRLYLKSNLIRIDLQLYTSITSLILKAHLRLNVFHFIPFNYLFNGRKLILHLTIQIIEMCIHFLQIRHVKVLLFVLEIIFLYLL
jgi:hypothetical protein